MPSNFFDAITLADKETVQSAVIAWLFSSDCNAFTHSAKLKSLKAMFDIQENLDHVDEIERKVEWENMDILFILKEKSIPRYALVVENKIKCDLHDDQLNRYERVMTSKTIIRFKKDKQGCWIEKDTRIPNEYSECEHRFRYLTLLERPDLNNWGNISYGDLCQIVTDALKESEEQKNEPDYLIVQSYLSSITTMAEKSEEVVNKYPVKIFTNSPSEKDAYIEEYKLRHVLQVYYLRSIRQRLIEEMAGEFMNYKLTLAQEHVWIGYGIQSDNAEIGIVINDGPLIDKYLTFSDNKKGDFTLSFQSGTFKIAVGKDYWGKDKEANSRLLIEKRYLRSSSDARSTVWDEYANKNAGWKVNPPKRGYPRMAISKRPVLSGSFDDMLVAFFKDGLRVLLTIFPLDDQIA